MSAVESSCLKDLKAPHFAAGERAVVVTRSGKYYEVRIVDARDCRVIEIVAQTRSLASGSVEKALRRAGLSAEDIAKFLDWARGLGQARGRGKEEVARLLKEVIDGARRALAGDLSTPHLNVLIPKRDKTTVTGCRPAECWQRANAAAVRPRDIDPDLAILDFDSERALAAAARLGFDPNKHMHILAGPAVDGAVLTPEGLWRLPDGRVLERVPRRIHLPVYVPGGCKRDLRAPGLEVKCKTPVNIAGRHPSGAEYELVDGELLEASWRAIKDLVAELGGDLPGYERPPECSEERAVDVDELAGLFGRVYALAHLAGCPRHDAIYDLAILGRFACVKREVIEEVVRRVYGSAGEESQTLSQRLNHVERAYRAVPPGSGEPGPKLKSPEKILEAWYKIDREAAEMIAKILNIGLHRAPAAECLEFYMNICERRVVARPAEDSRIYVLIESYHCKEIVNKKTWEVEKKICGYFHKAVIYHGPKPRRVYDVTRQMWYYEIGGYYGTDLRAVVEKLRKASAGEPMYISSKHLDELIAIFQKVADRHEVALAVGILPAESGAALVDDHGILDTGPSPEDAVADLERALRSVLKVYPPENHDAALASAGYVLALNAAPVWWFHKPNAEVPLPIIHGESGLGKSELMRRVVELAVIGLEARRRIVEIRKKIVDEQIAEYLAPEVYKATEYFSAEQFRNDLDANPLVLIVDEQRPGDPRSERAPAKIYGRFWLQVSTAEWGRRLAQHASRYGGGFGYKFFRQRAFAIVTNYPPEKWKRAGLALGASAEGAVDRRIFEIPWENVKLDGTKLDKMYTPRYSVLGALVHVINKHFRELISAGKFADFAIKLWLKVAEEFEPRLGRLEGIRRMAEALEKLKRYNEERLALRDPVTAAREELRRNALEYLREEAKVPDLSPARLAVKVIEYAQELGLVFRKPKWADEVDRVREDFCRALAAAVGVPDYDCSTFVTTRVEEYKTPAEAPLFNLIADRELREALWRVFVDYAARGYVPSVLAGSVLWPKNTRALGKIPRTPWKRPDGTVECYYKLSWQEFFETFVGRLFIAEEETHAEETATSPAPGVERVEFPKPLTGVGEQATNIETAPPSGVNISKAQSELNTLNTLNTAPRDTLTEKDMHAHHGGRIERCKANIICWNRLQVCIWRSLRGTPEEKKKLAAEELERRGELFYKCLADAEEYAERESGA
jgi:hypothetical protein